MILHKFHIKFDDGTNWIVLYKNKRVNISVLIRCKFLIQIIKLINLIKI